MMPEISEPMLEIHKGDSFPLHDEQERPRGSLEERGLRVGRFIAGLLRAKRKGVSPDAAGSWVEQRWNDKRSGEAVTKALNTTGTSTGGALVPQDFARDFIELLRAETVIRRAGPMTFEMPKGNATFSRLLGGAVAGFQAELDDMIVSQETFDDLQLNAKKLTCLVPVSNDLLRRSPLVMDAMLRNDLIETAARREDIAFLTGDGSGESPVGLLNQVPAAQKLIVNPFSAFDDLTLLTETSGTLYALIAAMKSNMARMVRPVWISTPPTFEFIGSLSNGNGQYPFSDEMSRGRLLGCRFFASQQLPSNLVVQTGGSSQPVGSYLFLIDMADVVLADTTRLEIDVSDSASYTDVTGSSVSSFVRDQMLYRAILEMDFGLRHQAACIVATLPGWMPAGWGTVGGGSPYYVQGLSGDGSAAASTWGIPPTGSNDPGNKAAVAPGGTQPGRA